MDARTTSLRALQAADLGFNVQAASSQPPEEGCYSPMQHYPQLFLQAEGGCPILSMTMVLRLYFPKLHVGEIGSLTSKSQSLCGLRS